MDSLILLALFAGIAALLFAVLLLVRQIRDQHDFPELSEGMPIGGVPAEASSVPAYDLDVESGHLQWNDAFYNTFGYRLSEPVGSVEWWTGHIHPEDTLTLTATLDKLADKESAGWNARYRFRKADGTYVRVRDEAFIRRDDDGKAIHLTGSITIVKTKK